jgi:hypothetical protein
LDGSSLLPSSPGHLEFDAAMAVPVIAESLLNKEDRAGRREDRWYGRQGILTRSRAAEDDLPGARFK